MGFESGISLFVDCTIYGLGLGGIVFLIGLTCGDLLKYLSNA